MGKRPTAQQYKCHHRLLELSPQQLSRKGRKGDKQRGKAEPRLSIAPWECPSHRHQMNLNIQLSRLPFPPPVHDHLRVEGDGPGRKVYPANHLVYDTDDVAADHQEAYPWARKDLETRMS